MEKRLVTLEEVGWMIAQGWRPSDDNYTEDGKFIKRDDNCWVLENIYGDPPSPECDLGKPYDSF